MKKQILDFLNNRIVKYVLFGGLTTLVNLVSYYLFRRILGLTITPANILSVSIAIVFAYIVNSKYVFESVASGLREKVTEFFKFIGARLSTMVIEVGGVWLLAEVIGIDDMIGKIITQVIVLVLNYVFSKVIVFKK